MNTVEQWTFAAVVAAGVGFMLLERRFPYNKGQLAFRKGFWIDIVLYCVVQSYVLGVIIGRVIHALQAHAQVTLVGHWPLVCQLALFLVTHDLYIYLFHRTQHAVPLLWRLHEAHHSAADVDWLSGVRSHALEILVNQTVEFAPIVLLGAAPAVAVLKGAISAIWGMFIHANLDVRLGPLQYVFNGPEMHRWHHATDPAARNKNFATKFAWWDWLFGTAYFPDRGARKAERYGLAGIEYPERFPLDYFVQQAYAFRPPLVPKGES